MGLSSEYEKLLDIIDEEKKNSEKHTSKPVKDNKPEPKENITKKDVEQKDNKPDIGNYQSLDINSFYSKQPVSSKNTEFNVEKFKTLMRKKLITNYYRIREYKRPYISVTEILSCLRKSYYERMKYTVNDSDLFNFPQLLLIQEVGNKVHDLVSENYDFDEVEKVLKSENFKLKGRVDAIKNSTIFEIKTVDPSEFKQIQKIRENDYNQGIVYGYILNNDYGYNISSLEVIYISRDLKNFIVLKSNIDVNTGKDIVDRSLELYECLKLSKPPLSYYDSNDNECKYCPFKKNCKSEDNEKLKDDNVKKKSKVNTFVLGD